MLSSSIKEVPKSGKIVYIVMYPKFINNFRIVVSFKNHLINSIYSLCTYEE